MHREALKRGGSRLVVLAAYVVTALLALNGSLSLRTFSSASNPGVFVGLFFTLGVCAPVFAVVGSRRGRPLRWAIAYVALCVTALLAFHLIGLRAGVVVRANPPRQATFQRYALSWCLSSKSR